MARRVFEETHDPQEFPLSFESLRWFMLLDATQWSHLPVAGGWYDQHPVFMDEIMMIFDEKAKVERKKNQNQGGNQADPQAMARQAAVNAGVPYLH